MVIRKPIVWFRADGNTTIGLGHVIRSLSLVEMLLPSFDCRFIIRAPFESLKHQIETVCHIVVLPDTPSSDTIEAEMICNFYFKKEDIVVLDGYHFTTDYQQIIKQKGCQLVCIDDIYTYPFLADVIINHAGNIQPSHYQATTKTKFYLGLKYALLRSPFRKAAQQKAFLKRTNRNIFVCLGGADPNNDTQKVLEIIFQAQGIDTYYVVIGSAYKHHSSLDRFLALSGKAIKLLQNINAEEMLQTMQECAVAVCSPSTVAYEYLSVGGILYLYQTADNQKDVYSYFVASGLAFTLSEFPVTAIEKITTSTNAQQLYLDGQQAKRFEAVFHDLLLDFRAAQLEDCDLYFEWANEPTTRAQSFSQAAIPYESHVQWFQSKYNSATSLLWVATYQHHDIGQIRFDIKAPEAIISFSLAPAFRGRGLGNLMLEKGIQKFRGLFPNYTLVGYVKHENVASNKAFQNLGFKQATAPAHEAAYRYTL